MKKGINPIDILGLTLLASLLFFPGLGLVHLFDWDEINFAESAREMLLTNNLSVVTINFEPFWEKPPLFIWMQWASFKIFGVSEYAARFPNAVAGLITIFYVYIWGTNILNRKLGIFWAILFMVSWLPHFYFKSGIIDPWFNFFIYAGYYQLIKISIEGTQLNYRAILAGVFIGLSILTKGPVGLLLATVPFFIFTILFFRTSYIKFSHFLLFAIFTFIVSSIWYVPETIKNGTWFISTFIEYQIRLFATKDAGHGGFLLYHWVVVLVGCFPASFFLFANFSSKTKLLKNTSLYLNANILILLSVLVIFTIVKTKIVHYSSLAYFPVTFLGALGLHKLLENRQNKSTKKYFYVVSFVGFLLAIPLIALPYLGDHLELIKPYIKDPFAIANLDADVQWSIFDALGGVCLFIALIMSIISLKAKNKSLAFVFLCIGSILMMQFTSYLVVPKIEKYSQNAVISFLKEKSAQGNPVHVIGYKSYAHYFYTQKQPNADSILYNPSIMLTKPSTQDTVFFVTKIHKAEGWLKDYPLLRKLYSKNGYVFMYNYHKE
jgi:4-amino-4-deoxy-L-arabinose transferase-like glycosyltransferase